MPVLDYFDPSTNKALPKGLLAQWGIPIEACSPIETIYPTWDNVTQTIVANDVVKDGDKYVRTFNVVELPADEIAVNKKRVEDELFGKLREKRDELLAKTDYLVMPDYPISEEDLAKIKAYRQALRDLPSLDGAPWDGGGEGTPWPEEPEIVGTDTFSC